jgi:hypothetical protein
MPAKLMPHGSALQAAAKGKVFEKGELFGEAAKAINSPGSIN